MENEHETNDRETLDIDLTDDEFLYIAKQAHERDITFNKMIEQIIMRFMMDTMEDQEKESPHDIE